MMYLLAIAGGVAATSMMVSSTRFDQIDVIRLDTGHQVGEEIIEVSQKTALVLMACFICAGAMLNSFGLIMEGIDWMRMESYKLRDKSCYIELTSVFTVIATTMTLCIIISIATIFSDSSKWTHMDETIYNDGWESSPDLNCSDEGLGLRYDGNLTGVDNCTIFSGDNTTYTECCGTLDPDDHKVYNSMVYNIITVSVYSLVQFATFTTAFLSMFCAKWNYGVEG